MPVEWAIAQSDTRRLDRFTARCRVSIRSLQTRPRWASQHVLYRPSDASAEAYVCRVAIAPDTQDDEDCVSMDPTVFVSTSPGSIYQRVIKSTASTHSPQAALVSGVPRMHWIPRHSVQHAVSVTLEVDISRLVAPRTVSWARQLLGDVSYRQLAYETLQHHLLVCKTARVLAPLPDAFRRDVEGDQAIVCRVVATYPAGDFVRISPNTRVSITLPDDAMGETATEPQATVEDDDESASSSAIGGLREEIQALREMIMLPITHRDVKMRFSVEFPKGLLLCGPPGVGKTLLVRTVVRECRAHIPLHLEVVNGSEIMTSTIGDAEQTLRELFRQTATRVRDSGGAGVIFIDELDALCPKRDAHGAMAHSRIVAQLLTLLDGADADARQNVVVVGATNLPNNIDPALRRPGRFDREIFLSPPDAAARRQIFEVHMREMPFQVRGTAQGRAEFVQTLATRAIGYVGADIASLCREALSIASTRQFVELTRSQDAKTWWTEWKRHGKALHVSDVEKMVAGIAYRVQPVAIPLWFLSPSKRSDGAAPSQPSEFFSYLFQGIHEQHEETKASLKDASRLPQENGDEPAVFEVTMADFEQAMQVVVASALRSTSSHVKGAEQLDWSSIGGQEDTKLALQQALEWPLKFPETFRRLGISPPRGILLYGPPGCSKSTIVRAAAHSSGATFLSLSAAQVFSPFFGDAEASIRQLFRDARAAAPAILFLDEIDVLVAKRDFGGDSEGSGGSTALRVLSTLLNEMDGVESAEGLLVIGATNRPDCIDAALLRPGRFDRILLVDLPDPADREAILGIHTRGMTLDRDVDLASLARETPFFSGAELENLCREAALHALRESIDATSVCMRHFVSAKAGITPVSTAASMENYYVFADRMGSQ
ncbi:hypothetical protein P43SY_002692 [Pythium insidiosum]|uniref:AAA+ ATPase domain-containing protein n=1 Tax=Pythium insidiosum TaxID=114742 RepID=A0AAD5MAC9_PYTIN|nr:hypothetical protein P43SY_002692 [Pythium insidiosum]